MPKIATRDAQPGQILARPATTRAGMVMVRPGQELTTALIERLTNLGIDSVVVEGPNLASVKPPEVALRELDERFVGHENDKWMMELKAILARQITSASSTPDNV